MSSLKRGLLTIEGGVTVLDSDTIEIARHRVRLHRIVVPESG